MKSAITLSLSLILALATLPGLAQQDDAAAIRERLIGSYRLAAFDAIDASGAVTARPYTVGQISYDAAGRMSAQVMPDGWGDDSATEIVGFISYFGDYTINAEEGYFTHHVEGAYATSMLGQAMRRYFRFADNDNTLILEVRNNGRVTGRIRWQRISADSR